LLNKYYFGVLVNENQNRMLLEHLKNILSDLKIGGPYGGRQRELDRIREMEDIRDLMNQLKGIG
jgi:hypothetical protein